MTGTPNVPGFTGRRHPVYRALPGLGPLESAIMTAIWNAEEPVTIGDIRRRVARQADPSRSTDYSTVASVTLILRRKGFLKRDKDLRAGSPRSFWYEPVISREAYLAAVIRSALGCTPDRNVVLTLAFAASLDAIPGLVGQSDGSS
jgi:predicted transcriptional regulator